MPEERSAELLVSPMGDAESLTKHEHAQLDLCRQLLTEDTALAGALEWLLQMGKEPEQRSVGDAAIMKWMVDHYLVSNNELDDAAGLLIQRFTTPGEADALSAHELQVLSHTLITMRLGGWFPGWLACQVGTIADAKVSMPDDQYPSPFKIAGTLGLAIMEWQDELDVAKRIAARRPDLLFPVMHCEGDDPELVLETPPTEPKPKLRRARHKARKAA